VIAVDCYGAEVAMERTTGVRLVADDSACGNFINAAGDTVPGWIQTVAYGDLRDGKLKYLAKRNDYFQCEGVFVRAELAGTGIEGEGAVYLMTRILLGETKYFRAKNHPFLTGRLLIEETVEPVIGDAIPDDVWHDNPVTAVGGAGLGMRLGVYWEKEKPLPGGGGSLPRGLIRLIGRYWQSDSTYRVTLEATTVGRSHQITIVVRRPDSLGRPQANPFNATVALDLNNVTYNVDSLVTLWAGKMGSPPEAIKGIMKKESFHFNPSYRYEPLKDAEVQNKSFHLRRMKRNAYWIESASNIGNPPPPANVINLRNGSGTHIQYPGYRGTAWDYFIADSNSYAPLYRDYYKDRRARYRDTALAKLRPLHLADSSQRASIFADTTLWRFIRDTVHGGGLEKRIAQTRLVASYGPMQLIYYDGISTAYTAYPHDRQTTPPNQRLFPPERLNQPHEWIEYSIRHLIAKFRTRYRDHPNENIDEDCFRTGSYRRGFDETYRRVLNAYNGNLKFAGSGGCSGSDYGSLIMCWYYTLLIPRMK
jgi:hypothetical protein